MNKVINFLIKYKSFYKEYFINDRLKKCKYGYTCDIDQIYCHLNLININISVYYKFYELSKKYFNLTNLRLLELSCGYIPILSALYIENNINITAVNNKILFSNYKGVKTIEFDLNKPFNMEKYDLILGIRPCTPTEKIIDECYKYKKNFIFYLCPCIHNSINNINFSSYNEWVKYLKNKLKNFENYTIIFTSSIDFPDNCPIVIGKYNLK